jgi:hypothetical protein
MCLTGRFDTYASLSVVTILLSNELFAYGEENAVFGNFIDNYIPSLFAFLVVDFIKLESSFIIGINTVALSPARLAFRSIYFCI